MSNHPAIRKVLELSPKHIEPKTHKWLLRQNILFVTRMHEGPFSWLIAVTPKRLSDFINCSQIPPEVVKIMDYAYSLECDLILFSKIARENPDLPVFETETV